MRAVSSALARRLLASSSIDEADARALLDAARALRRSGLAARLKGRHLALVCQRVDAEGARRFDAAARALGARVSRIAPDAAWLREDAAPDAHEVRLIERLYDALDWEEAPPGLAQRLQARLAVPVFDGLASDDGPVLGLLARFAPGAPADEDDRRALVQAALVGSLS